MADQSETVQSETAQRTTAARTKFWTSQIGIILAIVLGVAVVRLAQKLEIDLFIGIGLLVSLLVVCVGLHVFFLQRR